MQEPYGVQSTQKRKISNQHDHYLHKPTDPEASYTRPVWVYTRKLWLPIQWLCGIPECENEWVSLILVPSLELFFSCWFIFFNSDGTVFVLAYRKTGDNEEWTTFLKNFKTHIFLNNEKCFKFQWVHLHYFFSRVKHFYLLNLQRRDCQSHHVFFFLPKTVQNSTEHAGTQVLCAGKMA